MADNRQIRDALSNLAQEARNLLDNVDGQNSLAIERRLMQTSTPTTSQTGRESSLSPPSVSTGLINRSSVASNSSLMQSQPAW